MPRDKQLLYLRGKRRVEQFCLANGIEPPIVRPPTLRTDWVVGACAYYRPVAINICLEDCAWSATEGQVRNWNWPGSITDREPYGVLAHELGHHVDLLAGERKGRYYSEYGEGVMSRANEPPITSYCPNPAEWFAEMFRLFVTNAALLSFLRPITFALLNERWKPISSLDWVEELGSNVPERIVNNLRKKVSAAKRYP